MNNIKAFLGENVSYNGELDVETTEGDLEVNTLQEVIDEEDPLGEQTDNILSNSDNDIKTNVDTNFNPLLFCVEAEIKLEY